MPFSHNCLPSTTCTSGIQTPSNSAARATEKRAIATAAKINARIPPPHNGSAARVRSGLGEMRQQAPLQQVKVALARLRMPAHQRGRLRRRQVRVAWLVAVPQKTPACIGAPIPTAWEHPGAHLRPNSHAQYRPSSSHSEGHLCQGCLPQDNVESTKSSKSWSLIGFSNTLSTPSSAALASTAGDGIHVISRIGMPTPSARSF